MKKFLILGLLFFSTHLHAQIFQYVSDDLLSSQRDKFSLRTLYSLPLQGSAIFRIDTDYHRATLFFTEDKATLAFSDLVLEEHSGIHLYKGSYNGYKLLIMIAEKDNTISIIFEDRNLQDGFVLKAIKKTQLNSLFE